MYFGIGQSQLFLLTCREKTRVFTCLFKTRNLPGVARVKTLICKGANTTNFLPSLIYDIWAHIRTGEHFRETILDYVMLKLSEGCSYNKC